MKNQNAARAAAGLSILLAAAVLAGLTTYVYGRQFQHPRYWGEGGTISKVQAIDMDLIEALLTYPGAGPLPDSQESVAPLFSVLDGKLAFDLRRGERVVYRSVDRKKTLQADRRVIALADGATLTVHRYQPPPWNSEFFEWLGRPLEWRISKYDRITVPFLGLLLIYVVFLSALAWRHRARHLSEQVLAELRRLPEPRA